MQTCCPSCQTTFRVTSEQIRARAGKVRCGSCRTVFNAIDSLLDESDQMPVPVLPASAPAEAAAPASESATSPAERGPDDASAGDPPSPLAAPEASGTSLPATTAGSVEPAPASSEDAEFRPVPAGEADPVLPPGETREVPADRSWRDDALGKPVLPTDKSAARAFAIAASLLAATLAAQLIFHFRSAIAIRSPGLRPALEALSDALGSDMPLPRHSESVSIETSDLQTDPGRNKLLALQATLRNRASYAQAYPALELTLTDTNDKAVARRVLLPEEYLAPAALEERSFAANTDVDVRLWLEAREINAAGYRLYVFYP